MAEVFMAHVENSAGVAKDDLITVLREPKGKGALFRCNKRTARLEKAMENEDWKGSLACFIWMVIWIHHVVDPEEVSSGWQQ